MRLRICLAALTTVALACSSESATEPGDAGQDSATVTCQNDPRVATYVANLEKASPSGGVKVTLVSSEPAPPVRGTNQWKIRVTDGGGAAISNAALTITPFMPDHGHGTSIAAKVTPEADGVYTIQPVYLFMPGVWRITIAVPTATSKESVDFSFCVAG